MARKHDSDPEIIDGMKVWRTGNLEENMSHFVEHIDREYRSDMRKAMLFFVLEMTGVVALFAGAVVIAFMARSLAVSLGIVITFFVVLMAVAIWQSFFDKE